jgi:ABC-type antimicrobial peptide transport system permease subunit
MTLIISLIKRILIYGLVGLIAGGILGFFIGMELEWGFLAETSFYNWLDSLASNYGLFAEEYAPMFFAEVFAIIGVILAIIVTIYEAKKKSKSSPTDK